MTSPVQIGNQVSLGYFTCCDCRTINATNPTLELWARLACCAAVHENRRALRAV